MYQPSLLYTTEEHGSSLTTFYQVRHQCIVIALLDSCEFCEYKFCFLRGLIFCQIDDILYLYD